MSSKKDKLYIFFTVDIRLVGGIQMYLGAKGRFLESKGWDVVAFFDGYEGGKSPITYLNKFLKYETYGLRGGPYDYPENISTRLLNQMVEKLGNISGKEIVVESHDHNGAMWGELLAQKISAKHICLICNENFEGKGKRYRDFLDFYNFKHLRYELAGIVPESLPRLFEGYKDVPDNEAYYFIAYPGTIVDDVLDDRVNKIATLEWNIAYIGRPDKGYVTNIIDGVADLAIKYRDKKICFIIVGDSKPIENYLKLKFGKIKNVTIKQMGYMIPIPRSIFEKIDVVVAGSGCAAAAVYEGVTTIVADAGNYLSNGVYKYDTFSLLFHEPNLTQTDFFTPLEKVLVNGGYEYDDSASEGMLFDTTAYDLVNEMINPKNADFEYYVTGLLNENRETKPTLQMILWAYFPWITRMIRSFRK